VDLVKIRKKAKEEREKKEKTHPPPSDHSHEAELAPAPLPSSPTHQAPVPGPDTGGPMVSTGTSEIIKEAERIPVIEGTNSGVLVPSHPPGEKEFLELASEELYKQSYIREEVGERLELLCFRLSTEEYAIPITGVKEIIRPREMTEVPRVPEYILGVISLRGVIIPVFDLRRRLGLPVKEATKSTRVVIASDDIKTLGMVVDEVTQVIRIPSESLEPPPPVIGGIEGEFIQGVGRDQHKMVILLNLKKILDLDISLDMRL